MNENLSIQEHGELSQYLQEIREHIFSITAITNPKLPKRSRVSENIWKLQRTVDHIKCLLDSIMFEQNQEAPYPSVYYDTGRKRLMRELGVPNGQ